MFLIKKGMTFLQDMKVRAKLVFAFGFLLLVVIVGTSIGIITINFTRNTYSYAVEHPIGRYITVNYISIEMERLKHLGTLMAVYSGDYVAVNAAHSDAVEVYARINNLIIEYQQSIADDFWIDNTVGANLVLETVSLSNFITQYFDEILTGIYTNSLAGDRDSIFFYIAQGANLSVEMNAQFDALAMYTQMVLDDIYGQVDNLIFIIMAVMATLAIMGLVIGLATSALIASVIVRPIRRLVSALNKVSKGDFNIKRAKVYKDELGNLTSDVYSVIEIFESLIDEFITLVHEISVNGNIKYRIDSTRYDGEFKIFCDKVNDLLENFTSDLFLVFDVFAAIEEGDFNVKVPRLPGEKAIINQHFDDIMKGLKDIHGEIAYLFQCAAEGKLDVQADVSKYRGGWAELISEMNALVSSVADPLAEIEVVLAEMAKGKFETYVTGDYKGAFDAIKQAVNSTGEDLVTNVTEITGILQAIAVGDLNVPVDRSHIGSYTVIKKAIIDILKSLNESMWSILGAAGQVNEGATMMATNATQLADDTSRQAAAIASLTETIGTITEKTKFSAAAADTANQRAIESTNSAQAGSQDMKSMVEAMNGIKASSDNISKIIGVIEGIASQTNLLALNATVEAARAAEHGKGFAVVAEEVKSLSIRSQTATKETSSEIETSIQMVEEGMKAATSTAASLDMILTHVQEVSQLISQIAEISKEQAASIEQVSQNVNDISQVVYANSATSEEFAAASHQLDSQAHAMQQAISFFKVRPPREVRNKQNVQPAPNAE